MTPGLDPSALRQRSLLSNPRCQSMVRCNPSSSPVLAVHPSASLASEESGRLCTGSSGRAASCTMGASGRPVIADTALAINRASSLIVVSCSQPRFIGPPSHLLSIKLSRPATQSSTYWKQRVELPSPFTTNSRPRRAAPMKLHTTRPSSACIPGPYELKTLAMRISRQPAYFKRYE